MNALVIKAQQSILTVTIYRPPKHNTNFLSEFPDFMSIVLTSCDRIISLGDFNFHINDTADSKVVEFLDVLACFGLVQHVKRNTHNHGNTLDLVITRDIEIDISDMADVSVSYHFCAFLMPLCLHQNSVMSKSLMTTRTSF